MILVCVYGLSVYILPVLLGLPGFSMSVSFPLGMVSVPPTESMWIHPRLLVLVLDSSWCLCL